MGNEFKRKIYIQLFAGDKSLGFKSDTFWSLTQDVKEAKQHTFSMKQIEEVYIENLLYTLNFKDPTLKEDPIVRFLEQLILNSKSHLVTSNDTTISLKCFDVETSELMSVHTLTKTNDKWESKLVFSKLDELESQGWKKAKTPEGISYTNGVSTILITKKGQVFFYWSTHPTVVEYDTILAVATIAEREKRSE